MDNLRRSSRIKSGPAAAGGGDSAAGSEDPNIRLGKRARSAPKALSDHDTDLV